MFFIYMYDIISSSLIHSFIMYGDETTVCFTGLEVLSITAKEDGPVVSFSLMLNFIFYQSEIFYQPRKTFVQMLLQILFEL